MKKSLLYKIIIISIVVIAILGFISNYKTIEKIINENKIILQTGDKTSINLSEQYNNITYISENELVVEIDEEGNITALSKGETNIIVKSNDKTVKKYKVKVLDTNIPGGTTIEPITPDVPSEPVQPQEPTQPTQPTQPSTPTTPTKKDDQITVNYKSVTYTGSKVTTTATSKSGLSVTLVYYSDSACKTKVTPINIGTYYAIGSTAGNESYNKATTPCTKAITIQEIPTTGITLSKSAIMIKKDASYTVTAIITPTDATNKSVTWTSSNNKIATVKNGVVTGVARGNVTITATNSNGNKAYLSVSVAESNVVVSYESSTLAYYIEQPSDYHIVTHIWVKDAYSQMKTALTSAKSSSSQTPRNIENPTTIMQNEIKNKGYQSKGFVAVNASPMVSTLFYEDAPANWFGTPAIQLVVNNGKIIRNSIGEDYFTKNFIYGLGSDGYLKYYKYHQKQTDGSYTFDTNLYNKIKNAGIKYTFGFKGILVENKKVKETDTSPNIRQVLCQVDKNNFILITNTMYNTSESQRNLGFSFKSSAEYAVSMNCTTAFNLDGGGSTSYVYKLKNNQVTQFRTAYDNRGLADMLYFVEK